MYSRFVGPIDIAINAVCRNRTFSELYEIGALCTVMKCNIRTIYPQIDVQYHTAIANNVFMPLPPAVATCEVKILWSHTSNENEARITNNSAWSPNHFVPLMLPFFQHESNNTNQSVIILPVVIFLFVNKHAYIYKCV
jgi:hypothetical protein